jgi:type I restriction enzyme S subunit
MHGFDALPSGWGRTRLDRVATVNARIGWKALTAAEYQDEGYTFLATPNIKGREIDFKDVNFISEFRYQESPELKLRVGDVLLAKDGNTLGITNIVTHLPMPATVNGSIAVLRPFGIEGRFLRYVLASEATQGAIEAIKGGMGVPHLFQWDIKRLNIPLPPLDEQRRIADFLDTETARAKHVNDAKCRMLALLDEQEQSVIHAAVQGAKEPGPRNPSGLTWLGDVPEQWRVAAVSHEFEVLLGKMLNQERTEGEHLRPYLRNTNVQWDEINTEDLLRMNFPPSERRRYEVLVGDLLICEGGEPGRCAIWDGQVTEIYYQKALHRVRPRGQSSVRWLYYCMRAATALNVFAVEGNSTTIAHLTGEQLRAHRFPFPDRHVQDRLTARLDDFASRKAQLTQKIRQQTALLAERRQALITAAVTGQIDVTTARGVDAA